MLEIAARECVFHFNKHFLTDPTIPMWVLKTKGKTYYVNHVTANLPWSTKNTPDNSHTKGAIKFKNALIKIDDENCAELVPLTLSDFARLKTARYTRILINAIKTVPDYLKQGNIAHTKFKKIYGSCGSGPWLICDIKNPTDITLLKLAMPDGSFRILQENESYYKMYNEIEDVGHSDQIDKYEQLYDDSDDDDSE